MMAYRCFKTAVNRMIAPGRQGEERDDEWKPLNFTSPGALVHHVIDAANRIASDSTSTQRHTISGQRAGGAV